MIYIYFEHKSKHKMSNRHSGMIPEPDESSLDEHLTRVDMHSHILKTYKYSDLVFKVGKTGEGYEMFDQVAKSPTESNFRFNNVSITFEKKYGNTDRERFIYNQVRYTIYRYFDVFIGISSITDSQFIKQIGLYNKKTNTKIKDIVLNEDFALILSNENYCYNPCEICIDYIDAEHVPDKIEILYSGAIIYKNDVRFNLEN